MANSDLTLEKMRINERLLLIEEYIREGKDQRHKINETMASIDIRCKNAELMIHGDPKSTDKFVRDGLNRRLESVERRDENHDRDIKKNKDSLFRWAIGSITIGTGGAVIWLFDVIRQAFIKPH
jgi:hypothetical protein